MTRDAYSGMIESQVLHQITVTTGYKSLVIRRITVHDSFRIQSGALIKLGYPHVNQGGEKEDE